MGCLPGAWIQVFGWPGLEYDESLFDRLLIWGSPLLCRQPLILILVVSARYTFPNLHPSFEPIFNHWSVNQAVLIRRVLSKGNLWEI